MTRTYDPSSMPPEEALERLKAGNRRFIERARSAESGLWRPGLGVGQWPHTVVVSCSDSRSPGEIVFDQGLGDLFMIRIAGNVIAPSGIGSVEYAVTRLGVRLVVVMGHTHCGAVQATFDTFGTMKPSDMEHIKSITGRIAPHIAELAKLELPMEEKMIRGVRANALASLDQLRHGSALLEKLDAEGRVQYKACVLHLENGETEWLA